MPKKFLKASGWLLQILVIGNLYFATAFNLEAEYFARYEYFPNFHYFSTPICVVGLMICIYCFLANKNKDGTNWQTLHYLPFILITLGTLASGSITYTGEDTPSFWVVLMNTSILVPVSVFFFWKLGKCSILGSHA